MTFVAQQARWSDRRPLLDPMEVGPVSVVQVVIKHRALLAGRQPVENIAAEWEAEGFTAADVEAWAQAGCFDALAAESLRSYGVTPEQAAVRTLVDGHGQDGWSYSKRARKLGARVADGYITPWHAAELVGAR